MNQTFRVNIDLDRTGRLADFLNTLADYGSPRIVSYEAVRYAEWSVNTRRGLTAPSMVLEFTSYEDALEFAEHWFGDFKGAPASAKDCVETITV